MIRLNILLLLLEFSYKLVIIDNNATAVISWWMHSAMAISKLLLTCKADDISQLCKMDIRSGLKLNREQQVVQLNNYY